MSHQNHFAIDVLQGIDDCSQLSLQFMLNGGAGGGFFSIDQLCDELDRGGFGPGWRLPGLLAVEAATLGLAVKSVEIDEAVLGQLAKPKAERHHRVLQIVAQPAIGFGEHVLDDIAGINTPAQCRIEPQVNRAPQRLTMLRQQFVHCAGVAIRSAIEQ